MTFNRSRPDREQDRFVKDLEENTTVRVQGAWTAVLGASLLTDMIYKEGIRYIVESEDENYGYMRYFDANDTQVSAIRVAKGDRRVEIFFPLMLQEDGSELLTENEEALTL